MPKGGHKNLVKSGKCNIIENLTVYLSFTSNINRMEFGQNSVEAYKT